MDNRLRSKLTEEKTEKELLRLRKMTPEQRLKAQARLNARIKEIFFAGLSSRGFDRKKIVRLWKAK